MPKGPQSEDRQALSNAERQARYRARQAEQAGATIRYRRPADRRSRPQRWHDAVAELLALQAIVDLDLTDLANIQPPRGYGRD